MKKSLRGLTLIELLVAIAIFALLGLMSYHAIYNATQSQARLSEEYSDMQALARTLNRIETDLMQIGSRSSGQINTDKALTLVNTGDSIRLVYWRLDAQQGAKLSGFEYANGNIMLLRWKTSDSSQEPTKDALLAGVQSFKLQFAAKGDTAWRDSWPPASTRAAEVPDGIRLEMELVGKGRVSRVFALR